MSTIAKIQRVMDDVHTYATVEYITCNQPTLDEISLEHYTNTAQADIPLNPQIHYVRNPRGGMARFVIDDALPFGEVQVHYEGVQPGMTSVALGD